jgi:cobyrinic acid a,c-diamide synthase
MAGVLVIAGTGSGVGKTTVTLGLLEAWRRRGLAVQAFKVGPDFIDPGFHELVTGRPSYTLDGWMCGRDHVRSLVARHAADADLAIVEGMMGCFDGVAPDADVGSTAELARWLGAPVVLVLDASGQARSVAAVVHGFERFDPELHVAAVIANRVGGQGHAGLVREAIRGACRAEPVGALAWDATLTLPERHLGLVTAGEGPLTAGRLQRLADLIESSVDLDHLLALAVPLPRTGQPSATSSPPRVKLGVARDAAFQFYYRENLDRLRAAGAELVSWSPLADPGPPDVDGLYFGGGYPELHARTLADNRAALKAVAGLAAAGVPIYAECGGLMYLAESLRDAAGASHAMVGLLPAAVSMEARRLTLGYADVRFSSDTPLGAAGTASRGHEFHASTLTPVPASVRRVYEIRGRGGEPRVEGFLVDNALLSYVHLHFGSNPDLAPGFVDACARARR